MTGIKCYLCLQTSGLRSRTMLINNEEQEFHMSCYTLYNKLTQIVYALRKNT